MFGPSPLVTAGTESAVPVVFFLCLVLAFIAMFVFWVWGIVDAMRFPDPVWETTGQSKILWVLLMVLLGLPVTFVYMFFPRPALKRAAANGTGPWINPDYQMLGQQHPES